MKRIIALSAVFICVAHLFCGCSLFSPVNSFANAVKTNRYQDAVDIFDEKINGNSDDESKCVAVLQEALTKAWTSYVEESIGQEEFEIIMTTLNNIESSLNLLGRQLDEVNSNYGAVSASKTAFQNGMKQFEEGEYAEAIKSLKLVIPKDEKNFKTAVQKRLEAEKLYEQEIIEHAQKLYENGDYSAMFELINNAERLIGETSNLLEFEKEKRTAIAETMIDQSFEQENYLEVITTYIKAQKNGKTTISSDMTSKYSISKDKYSNDVLNRASVAFGDSKDYESAISILREAVSQLQYKGIDEGMIQLFNNAIDTYREFIPVSLFSLDCIQTTGIGVGTTDDNIYRDLSSNTYQGETVMYKNSYHTRDSYAVYNLNMRFSTLEGVVYVPYDAYHYTSAWESGGRNAGEIIVYGDDVELYRIKLSRNDYDPIQISINVSGVRILKIVIVGSWYEDKGWWSYSLHPMICLACCTVQK